MDNKKIGKLIAKKRKEKGLTQGGLAKLLSVSNKTISKWETGAGLPDISLLVDLSKALDLSVDDLLKGNDTENSSISYEKMFLIKKSFYKKYMIDYYFQKRLYWFIDLIAFMIILCGIACLPLNHYLKTYLDIVGKIFIFIGMIMILIPIIKIIYQIHCFQEYEVSYSLKDDGILYQQNDEAVFYYFSQFEIIKKKQFAILKKSKTILWISLDDIEFIENHLQENNDHHYRLTFLISLFLSVMIVSCLILQLGYLLVLKRFGFEYIHNQLEIIFYLMIICGTIIFYILLKKDMKQCMMSLLTGIGFIFIVYIVLSNNSSLQVIESFSPDFQNRVVLKYDPAEKKLYDYHYTYLCFAKKSDTTTMPFMVNKKGAWMTNDCYVLTYEDLQQNKQVYISTYGDRGNGISYFNVASSMQGEWFNLNNGEKKTSLSVNKGEITLKTDQENYTYTVSEMKQSGTIALVLYHGELPQYVIVLNENCQLDENNLINKKGTIQVIDLQDFSTVTLYCGTYKEDKEEQQNIDNEMRQQAIKLVNQMDDKLKADPTLKKHEDNWQLFKLTSYSQDYYTVTRDAYFEYLNLFHDKNIKETGQIKQINVMAGDIHDFYVEMNYTATITYQGETETTNIVKKYRIKQGDGVYLIADIGYRVPGNVGLTSHDPVIAKDTSQDSEYAYSIGEE